MTSEVIAAHKIKGKLFNKKINFLQIYILFKSNLIQTLYECQHYEEIYFHKIKYNLKGHGRSNKQLLFQQKSDTFIYEPILMKSCI